MHFTYYARCNVCPGLSLDVIRLVVQELVHTLATNAKSRLHELVSSFGVLARLRVQLPQVMRVVWSKSYRSNFLNVKEFDEIPGSSELFIIRVDRNSI